MVGLRWDRRQWHNKAVQFMAGKKWGETQRETARARKWTYEKGQDIVQRHTLSDVLPPAMPHHSNYLSNKWINAWLGHNSHNLIMFISEHSEVKHMSFGGGALNGRGTIRTEHPLSPFTCQFVSHLQQAYFLGHYIHFHILEEKSED